VILSPDRPAGTREVFGVAPGSQVRAVLFDFGGVLADEGFRKGLHAIADDQDLDADEVTALGMDCIYESGYVLGKGTEADFWALMRTRAGITGRGNELSRVILSRFVVRPWMLDLVRRLRTRRHITGILSDQTDWLDQLDARYHFLELFDHVFTSFRLGKGKRDPSLFDDVVQALGLSPAAVLFIDDDTGNVARARSRGLRSHLYTARDRLEEELSGLLSRR